MGHSCKLSIASIIHLPSRQLTTAHAISLAIAQSAGGGDWLQNPSPPSSSSVTSVGTHYCLAVGNNEGLELDETDKDEELGKGD